jgi:hypothetical protein
MAAAVSCHRTHRALAASTPHNHECAHACARSILVLWEVQGCAARGDGEYSPDGKERDLPLEVKRAERIHLPARIEHSARRVPIP